ncbi:MAG: Rieske 2Fe-2S domain-containing protein [Gammaproteobacteria bacterium]|nr:Rieske 2Fe-2S domain-containing protein [Gammaproteobacteria bacterium]
MQQSLQTELAGSLFALIDARSTTLTDGLYQNPVSNYICRDWHAREIDTLFRRYPLMLALSCQLPEPGSFLTHDHSGVPILLVRGEDGTCRAFLNVCRHRGARPAEGCGQTRKGFICPYHGWVYDTQGTLTALPNRDAFRELDRETHGLTVLPCLERDGLVWVVPNGDQPQVPDIDGFLAGLAPEIASYGLAGYHHYDRREMQHQMNWKVFIDTFLEPYHFAVLHKNTVGPIFLPDTCLVHGFGPHLREVLPRRSIESIRNQPAQSWDLITHSAVVYVLFPNTVLVVQIDHMEIWSVYPMGPDRCRWTLDFFIPEPATSDKSRGHWDKNMQLTLDTVLDEDFVVAEGIQRGFHAGAQEHVVYGRNEPALVWFERSVAEQVRACEAAARVATRSRSATVSV